MAAVAGPLPAPRAGRLSNVLSGVGYQWQVLIVIVPGTLMVILSQTIVNVALPRIITIFQTSVDQGQLIVTAYMVALAVVMPATGWVSDTVGLKRAYLATVLLFTLGSALCMLAPSIEALVFFRVLQGLGGGMTQPLGMSILFQTVPPSQRGTVMGVFGLPVLVSPVLGPTLGGYLVEYVDWRMVFTIGIPFGILAVLLGGLILRETPRRRPERFDWAGFILAAVGSSALLLGLTYGPKDGWAAPHIVVLWLIAAAAIPSWIVVELSQEHPLLDLTVLRDRTYLMATVVSFALTVAMFSLLLLLPLFLQNVRGLGPMETGLMLLPQGLAMGLLMPLGGRLMDRFGPRWLVIPGMLILAYATWQLSQLDLGTPDSTLGWVMFLRGCGMGLTMMPVFTLAMDTIPNSQITRAAALSNVMRQLSGAFGSAVTAALLLDREHLHQAVMFPTVTDTNIGALQFLSAAKTALLQQGLAEPAAEAAALMTLTRQVSQAASVRAYDDCFFATMVLILVGLIPALWLRRGQRAPADPRSPAGVMQAQLPNPEVGPRASAAPSTA